MTINSIIFDFDGTLVNSNSCIIRSFQNTIKRMGAGQVDKERITPTIGLPLTECFTILCNQTDPDWLNRATDIYAEEFFSMCKTEISLFEGVKTTLDTLYSQGYTLSIATSRGLNSLEMITENLGIRNYFTHLVCHHDVEHSKPYPDMVLKIIQKTEIPAENTLVVGDTCYDIEMGAGAQAHTVAVTYGNQTEEQISQSRPEYIIPKFPLLLDLLNKAR